MVAPARSGAGDKPPFSPGLAGYRWRDAGHILLLVLIACGNDAAAPLGDAVWSAPAMFLHWQAG